MADLPKGVLEMKKDVNNVIRLLRHFNFKDRLEVMDWLNSWYASVVEEDINNQLFKGVIDQ